MITRAGIYVMTDEVYSNVLLQISDINVSFAIHAFLNRFEKILAYVFAYLTLNAYKCIFLPKKSINRILRAYFKLLSHI